LSINFEKSDKYQAVRESLPPELRAVFRQFVEEYSFHTMVKYGRGYVAYEVLAELVRSGWRPIAEGQSHESRQTDR
jgi:hypothetical protein